MAGIQYSTVRTDATHAEATGASPFPIEPSRQAGCAPPNHPFPAPTCNQQQRKTCRAGELRHMARARDALGRRYDAKEEPMSDLAARFVYSPLLSTAFKVVCLFCVLGLALSVAIVPMIAPEYLAWVLSHIE
jgi:hypothetical protein